MICWFFLNFFLIICETFRGVIVLFWRRGILDPRCHVHKEKQTIPTKNHATNLEQVTKYFKTLWEGRMFIFYKVASRIRDVTFKMINESSCPESLINTFWEDFCFFIVNHTYLSILQHFKSASRNYMHTEYDLRIFCGLYLESLYFNMSWRLESPGFIA